LRIFSGYVSIGDDSAKLDNINKAWTPADALKSVFLTNEYLAKEHGEDGMFVTLIFCIVDPLTGKMYYVNGGHEPLFIIGKNGTKHSLSGTGPGLGPIHGASYEIKSIQLETGDILFSYTDGVTEAKSEAKKLYTRDRLEKVINKGINDSTENFLEMIKKDLFGFTGDAPQSDDITMLAVKWNL